MKLHYNLFIKYLCLVLAIISLVLSILSYFVNISNKIGYSLVGLIVILPGIFITINDGIFKYYELNNNLSNLQKMIMVISTIICAVYLIDYFKRTEMTYGFIFFSGFFFHQMSFYSLTTFCDNLKDKIENMGVNDEKL